MGFSRLVQHCTSCNTATAATPNNMFHTLSVCSRRILTVSIVRHLLASLCLSCPAQEQVSVEISPEFFVKTENYQSACLRPPSRHSAENFLFFHTASLVYHSHQSVGVWCAVCMLWVCMLTGMLVSTGNTSVEALIEHPWWYALPIHKPTWLLVVKYAACFGCLPKTYISFEC